MEHGDPDLNARAEVNRGGAIAPMVGFEWKAYVTHARVDELKAWLKQTQ